MARSDMVVFDSIQSSNIPRREKSAIRQWYEDISSDEGGIRPPVASLSARRSASVAARGRGTALVNTARAVGENGVVAGGLAYLHAELKNGLDVGDVPIDGAIGGLANALGIIFPNMEVSEDVKNIANSATSIFMFRKFYGMLAERKIANGGIPGGSRAAKKTAASMAGDVDPIVECAKSL